MQLIGIIIIIISILIYELIKSDYINVGKILKKYFKIFSNSKKEYYNFFVMPLLFSIGITLLSDDYSYLNSEISVIVGLILSMLFSGLSILAAYDFSKLSNKKIKEKFNKSMIDTVNAINFTTLFSIILLVLLVLIKVKFCYKLIICYFCVPINYIKLFLSIIVLYMFFIILINIFFIVKNLYQIVISKIIYSNNIND